MSVNPHIITDLAIVSCYCKCLDKTIFTYCAVSSNRSEVGYDTSVAYLRILPHYCRLVYQCLKLGSSGFQFLTNNLLGLSIANRAYEYVILFDDVIIYCSKHGFITFKII